MIHQILSMDGGNGWNTANLLIDIEKKIGPNYKGKGYLNTVNLFAGTSDGALNALFLANTGDPTSALNEILGFWSEVNKAMFAQAISPGSIFLGLSGLGALSSSQQLREFFINYFGADRTLNDLKGKVFIVSFQLDDQNPINRKWKPKFFSNLEYSESGNELIVDVAMRTTAFPILRPIYQALSGEGSGYTDGGVVANHPAMCALAETYRRLDSKLNRETMPHDLLMFSIGTGQNPIGKSVYVSPKMENGTANWGYREWMMDPRSPLLLLNMIMQSSAEAVDFQCRHLLRNRYHRLNPEVEYDVLHDNPEVEQLVAESVVWMRAEGWLKPEPETGPAGQPKSNPESKTADETKSEKLGGKTPK